ncbi:hypothetical protein VTP01DRAFT_926 [Rhizomucor pusillus]|uniref:uncharacterized protein n=1 Tax=Rhizomucor pusillus TaxID=4840 RepID=UPI003743A116
MSKTHILRYDGTPITDIKTATWHPKDVFWNFFDVDKIQILLQEQKRQPMWRLCYTDKYRIRVIGYKIVRANRKRKRKREKDAAQTKSVLTDEERDRIEQEMEELSSVLKKKKATVASLRRKLTIAEKKRTAEKQHGWNRALCSQLKEARGKADSLYLEIQEEEETIALKRNKLYHLNRQLKGQNDPLPCSNILSGEGSDNGTSELWGIDPGGVTTAMISPRSMRSLLEDINRFEALQEDTDQIADIDTDAERPRTFEKFIERYGTRDKKQMSSKLEPGNSDKSLSIKSSVRYSKRSSFKEPEKNSVIHFLGNWKPVNSRVKGRTCSGSLTKLEQTPKAPEPDKLYTIGEYNTTKTCGYCFKKIQIHKYRRDAETLPQLPISRLVVSQERYQMITNLFHASAVDEVKT